MIHLMYLHSQIVCLSRNWSKNDVIVYFDVDRVSFDFVHFAGLQRAGLIMFVQSIFLSQSI